MTKTHSATTTTHSKVALITGASRGIGRATALELAKQGYKIGINYVRNKPAALQVLEEVQALGVDAKIFAADVGEPDEAKSLINNVYEYFKRIDVLVHNAAIGSFKPTHKTRLNHWDITFNINARAFLVLSQAVIPIMEEQGAGNIVGLSSFGSQRYVPNYGAIGISKSALESTIRYLAAELRPKGIRVNGVSGGPIRTDAVENFPDFSEFEDWCVSRTPSGRIGEATDLSQVIGFLVSEKAEWIVGQTLLADGGLSLT